MRVPLGLLILLLAGCSSPPPPAPAAKVEEPVKVGPTPATFRVKFDTSKGLFSIDVTRDWAPHGADRFYELVIGKFYDEARFFRVVRHFVAQFGIGKDPEKSRFWSQMQIPDDPVKGSNRRGYVTFAKSGPGTRTTQVFINITSNISLDTQGFAPFGKVAEGMEVVDQLFAGYGDMGPRGAGPDPERLQLQGNEYLENHFPRLDYIKTARVVGGL